MFQRSRDRVLVRVCVEVVGTGVLPRVSGRLTWVTVKCKGRTTSLFPRRVRTFVYVCNGHVCARVCICVRTRVCLGRSGRSVK